MALREKGQNLLFGEFNIEDPKTIHFDFDNSIVKRLKNRYKVLVVMAM